MSDAPRHAFVEVFERQDQLFDWRLVGANGEIMCGSAQGYTSAQDATEGWRRCVSALRNDAIMVKRVR